MPAAKRVATPDKTEKKKSRPCTPQQDVEDTIESNASSPQAADTDSAKTFVFKDPNFVHSSKVAPKGRSKRQWKTLRQIVAHEKTLPWGPNDMLYGNIDAPPSFKPPKKYSDLSGLEAKYTDPHTKLRYASPDEFARIRDLPWDIVNGLLNLRKALKPVA